MHSFDRKIIWHLIKKTYSPSAISFKAINDMIKKRKNLKNGLLSIRALAFLQLNEFVNI